MKQRKNLAVLLVAVMMVTLSACGNTQKPATVIPSTDTDTWTQPAKEIPSAEVATQIPTEEPTEEPTPELTEMPVAKPTETPQSTTETEWRQFLKDYEAWVDSYIAFMEKYNANPSDLSLLTDYANMMVELADWSTRTDEVSAELENSPDELLEYSAELTRILAKLAKATN